ncbi:MAG: cryptochrome/photolyase family protein, partial [Planctomycetota bacterium]|nr:cryptochrome/photolyase family protein [Planctomycetota bacterium]
MTTSWNEASRALSNGKRLRSADSLLVIFGDQLDPGAPILNELDPKRDAILMMEVAEEAEHVPSHRQRTALFLAAMRHHALHLIDRGFRVRYITLDDDDNTHSFDSEFKRAADTLNPKRILVTHPGEHRVMKMVEGWSKSHEVQVRDDPHFYCSIEEFADWAEGRKQLTMEYFYREMRRKHDVLMTKQHKPVGGEWNFDKQNREAFKSTPRPPAP